MREQISVEVKEKSISVESSYSAPFVEKAKWLKGKWTGHFWSFPIYSAHALHSLLIECYEHEVPKLLEVTENQRPMPFQLNLVIDKKHLLYQSEKSCLFCVPEGHRLEGIKFWLPKSFQNELVFSDQFMRFTVSPRFTIKGETEEGIRKEILHQDLKEAFKDQEEKEKEYNFESYYRVKEPEKIEFDPKEIEVDPSLLR